MSVLRKLWNWWSPPRRAITYKDEFQEIEGWMWVRDDGVWSGSLDNSRIYFNRRDVSLGFNRDNGYHLNKVKVRFHPIETIVSLEEQAE